MNYPRFLRETLRRNNIERIRVWGYRKSEKLIWQEEEEEIKYYGRHNMVQENLLAVNLGFLGNNLRFSIWRCFVRRGDPYAISNCERRNLPDGPPLGGSTRKGLAYWRSPTCGQICRGFTPEYVDSHPDSWGGTSSHDPNVKGGDFLTTKR